MAYVLQPKYTRTVDTKNTLASALPTVSDRVLHNTKVIFSNTAIKQKKREYIRPKAIITRPSIPRAKNIYPPTIVSARRCS